MKNKWFRAILLVSTVVVVVVVLATLKTTPSKYSLEKVWETDSVLYTPESVLYDAKSKTLFVANIGDFEKAGSGSIAKLGLDGKIIQNNWITGLTAAKGMGLFNNLLYVAELGTVAVIDTEKDSIIQRIEVEGAKFLNDLTIDKSGNVYVSDSGTGKLHKINQGVVTVYLDNLKDINGLLSDGDDLYILSDSKMLKSDSEKKLTTIAKGIEGNADGIIRYSDDEFIVTGWEGIIYVVNENGTKSVLSDTRKKKINTADLGYNPDDKIIYIPTFSTNTVVAYKLE